MRTRFAPSPTGDLHLGSAYVALSAYVRARTTGGRFVVRMEDLDVARVVAGASDRILDDLEWLGLAWDEGPRIGGPHAPYEQSASAPIYDAAIDSLLARGLAYPCTCTRADLARTASAPHAGEEGPRYPGTCRDPSARRPRAPCFRLASPDPAVDDFVLRRADRVASYQLAVVVDDLAMQVDEVQRGDDLLASTPRQRLLATLLGKPPPAYMHLPMVLGPDGERLAKRHQRSWAGTTIGELRAAGVEAPVILGAIAAALGILDAPRPLGVDDVLACARTRPIAPKGPWTPPWVRRREGPEAPTDLR